MKSNFNANAENHPCMQCGHGGVWTEFEKPAGNTCVHPDIIKQKGLLYGWFHSSKRIPAWCPLKHEAHRAQEE